MTRDLKILFFDLENLHRPEHIFNSGKPGRFSARPAGFCADLAYILVFGYKWLGDSKAKAIFASKKEFTKDPMSDASLLQGMYDIMMNADVIVTWYGKGHDFPFLTTRLAQAGLYLDQNIKHIDLCKVAGQKMRLSSNRLNNVSKFFGKEEKTKVSPKLWADCWSGNYKSLSELAAYCIQDVEVLEQVYHKMKQLDIGLPVIKTISTSCQACGATHLEGNGTRVTKTKRYQRLRCQKCGGSQKGAEL